jgi:hypothetical protein
VGARRLIRRLVEPAPGTTRRIRIGPAGGITLTAEPAATASADVWVGLFESEIARYVRRFCRPGTISVDVGANSGYYSLTFAQRCRAPVVAYEPDPTARERLARNLDLNPRIAPWIDVRGFAVGDSDGPGSVTLDADLAEATRVGLLKIDVDGAEVGVLAGARRLLVEGHPDVILETHSAELEAMCGRLLIDAGYAPRVITPRRVLPQNRPAEHNRWLVADQAWSQVVPGPRLKATGARSPASPRRSYPYDHLQLGRWKSRRPRPSASNPIKRSAITRGPGAC